MNTKKFLAKCAIATASAVGAAGVAHAQSDPQKQQAYFNSDYQYCDALKIASVWGTDGYNGKLILGAKVLAGLTNLADADIASTGRNVPCRWRDLGLRYEDAQKLATFWGRSVGEAKTKAEQMASQIGGKRFHEQMGHVYR